MKQIVTILFLLSYLITGLFSFGAPPTDPKLLDIRAKISTAKYVKEARDMNDKLTAVLNKTDQGLLNALRFYVPMIVAESTADSPSKRTGSPHKICDEAFKPTAMKHTTQLNEIKLYEDHHEDICFFVEMSIEEIHANVNFEESEYGNLNYYLLQDEGHDKTYESIQLFMWYTIYSGMLQKEDPNDIQSKETFEELKELFEMRKALEVMESFFNQLDSLIDDM